MQFILDRFDEGLPTGFNDVLVNADRGPALGLVLEFDEDAHLGGGPGLGIDDAHFIIREMDLVDHGVRPLERLAKRGIQGLLQTD